MNEKTSFYFCDYFTNKEMYTQDARDKFCHFIANLRWVFSFNIRKQASISIIYFKNK